MDIDDELEKDLVRSIGKELIKVPDFIDKLKLNWVNKAAALLANRFAEMSKIPNEIKTEPLGSVSWLDVEAMFNEKCNKSYSYITIYDKLNKIHFVPVTHMDFCTLCVPMELNDETVDILAELTDSLEYDDDKRELVASGDFPTSAVVQFAMAKRVNNNKMSIADARETYKTWLKIAYDEWSDIIGGKPIERALLSAILERYVLN